VVYLYYQPADRSKPRIFVDRTEFLSYVSSHCSMDIT